MGDFKLSGGCQCGAVRYTIYAPANVTEHCHCSICRKCHGAIFVTLSAVPLDKLTIDQGADNLATFDSSPKVHRRFCKTCGCHLFEYADDLPDVVFLSTGTLDGGADPGHPKENEMHIFVGSKVPWYEITDNLPQHEEFSPGAAD